MTTADGRYKAVLECFTHAEDEADARYYFMAVEELRKFDVQQMRESTVLEFDRPNRTSDGGSVKS